MAARSLEGLNSQEIAEALEMQAAGFTWDTTQSGRARWTHERLEMTVLREDWMRDADWQKHRRKKLAESRKLRRFEDLPPGARFRMLQHVDSTRAVFIKMTDQSIVQWVNENRWSIVKLTEIQTINMKIVELFEPLADMLTCEQEKLAELPEVWAALADWHAWQSSSAEAADCSSSSKWHDEREAVCKKMAAALLEKRENG